MIKILYYSTLTHKQGGAIVLMYKLAQHFHHHPDFEAIVILPDSEGIAEDYAASNIPVTVVPFLPLGARRSIAYRLRYMLALPGTIWRIFRLIRSAQIDIVHVNEITFFPALIAAKVAGVPSVCHVRVILRNRFPWARRILSRFINVLSSHIISSSHATTAGLFDKPPKDRVTVSYDGGPDLQMLQPSRYNRKVLREKFGFGEAMTVGLVSKLTPVKGHRYLLQAAAILKDEHPEIAWSFVFVGGKVEGFEWYADELATITTQLGLDEEVLFLGQRADVAELHLSFDIAVHVPDHDDPFPGVVLEALAMERPLIATESGGIPEQFDDGVSGVLIQKGDVRALAHEIAALARNLTRRRAMGMAGRQFLLDNFSPERHFGEVERVYRQVLQEKRK